jgi:hypothetical protein
MGPFQFPSLFGDANVDALVEGDNQRRILLEGEPVAASGPITGTVATTEADDVSTASGTITITGTSATTEANDTPTASGTITITGTVATTEADDVSTASGAVTGDEPVAPTGGGRPPRMKFTVEHPRSRKWDDDDTEVLLLISL